ncbi:MAG: multicopper oxidase family protein [Hyphomicrobiaceae bacterium]
MGSSPLSARPAIRLTRRMVIAGPLAVAGSALLRPRLAGASSGTAEIVAAPATAALRGADKPSTGVWAYNGTTPGPVIRIRQGEELSARLVNRLAQPTTIHWHGIRIDNRMDGVPHLTQHSVDPDGSFDYRFTPPDAGTFWYHPHERSYEQVARGLFGILVVEEKDPPVVDHDIVLVVNDWRLGSDGSFSEATLGSAHDRAHAGRLGNVLTTNGTTGYTAAFRVNDRLRLRIVNCSSARTLQLALEGASARVIARDGQPLSSPAAFAAPLVLAAGNRADIIVDMPAEPGARVALTDVSGDRRLLASFEPRADASARKTPLDLPVALAQSLVPAPDMRDHLPVDLVMTGGAKGEMDHSPAYASGPVWQLNGVAGMTETPLFSAPRGRTAAVRIVNRTAWAHGMHFHGHHFRVVAREGSPVPVDDTLWDTLLVAPGETVTIAFVADNPGRWMIHCHMLDHQAAGMDTWFEVQS